MITPSTNTLSLLRKRLDGPGVLGGQKLQAAVGQQPSATKSPAPDPNTARNGDSGVPMGGDTGTKAATGPIGSGISGQQTTGGVAAGQQMQNDVGKTPSDGSYAGKNPNAQAAPQGAGTGDISAQEQAFISQLMGNANNVDTSKEDALLAQLFQGQQGKNLVNQRASMGRAGFGASGALAAGQGDVMRQSALDQSQAQFGFDSQAKQQAVSNALSGVNADIGLRTAGSEDATNQALLKLLGQDANAPAPPAETTNMTPDGAPLAVGAVKSGNGYGDDQTKASASAPAAGSPPKGAMVPTKVDANGTKHYKASDGSMWTRVNGGWQPDKG